MIAIGDVDIGLTYKEPLPFVLSRSQLRALEKLCLARLAEFGGDSYGEPVAKALLEGVAHFSIEEDDATRRAECALRLLKRIDARQRKEVSAPSPEKTKTVLWEALLYGWDHALDKAKEKILARGLLEVECFGHQEQKALSALLRRSRQFSYGREKVALLLTLARQNSNYIVLRFMANELAGQLSPADLVQIGRQQAK